MGAIHLCSGVVFVALVSRYVLGESLTGWQALGFALLVLGMALILGAHRS